jgi:hypothetical protein
VITDYETKKTIFEVGKDVTPVGMEMDVDLSSMDGDCFRRIKYTFSEDVLRLPLIGTTLVFKIGDEALSEFRMIERHYFRNKLVKSFDFIFGFCIPGSTNTWDALYPLPPLEDDMINDMIDSPYETTSDSFYFVGDKLVMHNKAKYRYTREDAAQSKRSYDTTYEHKNAGLQAKIEASEAKGGGGGGGGGESKAGAKSGGIVTTRLALGVRPLMTIEGIKE